MENFSPGGGNEGFHWSSLKIWGITWAVLPSTDIFAESQHSLLRPQRQRTLSPSLSACIPLSLHLFVCMCLHADMCVEGVYAQHVCTHASGYHMHTCQLVGTGWHQVSSSITLYLVFETRSLPELWIHQRARLASQRTPGIFPSLPTTHPECQD